VIDAITAVAWGFNNCPMVLGFAMSVQDFAKKRNNNTVLGKKRSHRKKKSKKAEKEKKAKKNRVSQIDKREEKKETTPKTKPNPHHPASKNEPSEIDHLREDILELRKVITQSSKAPQIRGSSVFDDYSAYDQELGNKWGIEMKKKNPETFKKQKKYGLSKGSQTKFFRKLIRDCCPDLVANKGKGIGKLRECESYKPLISFTINHWGPQILTTPVLNTEKSVDKALGLWSSYDHYEETRGAKRGNPKGFQRGEENPTVKRLKLKSQLEDELKKIEEKYQQKEKLAQDKGSDGEREMEELTEKKQQEIDEFTQKQEKNKEKEFQKRKKDAKEQLAIAAKKKKTQGQKKINELIEKQAKELEQLKKKLENG